MYFEDGFDTSNCSLQSDFDHGAYLFGTVTRNTVQTTASRRHGQYDDFYTTLQIAGMPRPNNVYVFLGDIVDRGPKQVEAALPLRAN